MIHLCLFYAFWGRILVLNLSFSLFSKEMFDLFAYDYYYVYTFSCVELIRKTLLA